MPIQVVLTTAAEWKDGYYVSAGDFCRATVPIEKQALCTQNMDEAPLEKGKNAQFTFRHKEILNSIREDSECGQTTL